MSYSPKHAAPKTPSTTRRRVTGAAVESERTGDPTIAEAKVKEATAAISRLMRS